MYGASDGNFLAPPPLALGRGQKVKYHLISITKSISRFLYQTLCHGVVCCLWSWFFLIILTYYFCMCAHKWKIQNISEGIFILLFGSCPRGAGDAHVVKSIFFSNMVMWHIKSTRMTSRTECKKNFILGSNWWPWGEVKDQTLNFGYYVNFKDNNTKLCVLSHKWKISKISDGSFILLPGSCFRGGTLDHWGCPGVIFFQAWSCGISNRRVWWVEQNASNILS